MVKYPRTFHVPFSGHISSDDKKLLSMENFVNKTVVISKKMDGENTTMYSDHIHARSIDGRYHSSRDWVKSFWGQIKHKIPEGYRICGENVFAKHSIHYNYLSSYFLGFSMWDNNNFCLGWDSTLITFDLLGINSVDVVYKGVYDEKLFVEMCQQLDTENNEGFVMRNANHFHYDDFNKNVVKFVRKNHVQTDKHWMHQKIIKNNLK